MAKKVILSAFKLGFYDHTPQAIFAVAFKSFYLLFLWQFWFKKENVCCLKLLQVGRRKWLCTLKLQRIVSDVCTMYFFLMLSYIFVKLLNTYLYKTMQRAAGVQRDFSRGITRIKHKSGAEVKSIIVEEKSVIVLLCMKKPNRSMLMLSELVEMLGRSGGYKMSLLKEVKDLMCSCRSQIWTKWHFETCVAIFKLFPKWTSSQQVH